MNKQFEMNFNTTTANKEANTMTDRVSKRVDERFKQVQAVLKMQANGVALNSRRIQDYLNVPQGDRKTFERDLKRMVKKGYLNEFVAPNAKRKNAFYILDSKYNQPLATQNGQ